MIGFLGKPIIIYALFLCFFMDEKSDWFIIEYFVSKSKFFWNNFDR